MDSVCIALSSLCTKLSLYSNELITTNNKYNHIRGTFYYLLIYKEIHILELFSQYKDNEKKNIGMDWL